MLYHTWQRAIEASKGRYTVLIATDDPRIVQTCVEMGADAVVTRADHENGTDRLAEVADQMGWPDDDIVINVQGDEPLLPPELIEKVGEALVDHKQGDIATLACPITSADDLGNPAVVKCVTDKAGFAHYFSRSMVPFIRDAVDAQSALSNYPFLRHIGMYAYRVGTLRRLSTLTPAPTESVEKLEQLRALWYGMKIHVTTIDEAPPHGVDTEEDLAAVRRLLAGA